MMDREVDAIKVAYFALAGLPPVARDRAVAYLTRKVREEIDQGLEAAISFATFARKVSRLPASGIAARSDETPQEVRPEGQEPGGEAETPNLNQGASDVR